MAFVLGVVENHPYFCRDSLVINFFSITSKPITLLHPFWSIVALQIPFWRTPSDRIIIHVMVNLMDTYDAKSIQGGDPIVTQSQTLL
jgi:hypothetical protein